MGHWGRRILLAIVLMGLVAQSDLPVVGAGEHPQHSSPWAATQLSAGDWRSIGPQGTPMALPYSTVSIPVGSGPFGGAYDPYDGHIYVTDWASGAISVISPSTDTVVGTLWYGTNGVSGIAAGQIPGYMFSPDYGSGVSGQGAVWEINTTSPGIHWVILNASASPSLIALDPARHMFFVNDLGLDIAYTALESTVGGSANSTVATHGPVCAFAYDAPRAEMFAALPGQVKGIADSSLSVVQNIATGSPTACGKDGLAYDPQNGLLYLGSVNQVGGLWRNITVIDPSSGTVVAQLPGGPQPDAALYDPWDHNVYFANLLGSNVSVLNTTTNLVTSTITVGSQPNDLAFDPATKQVFVVNYGSNNVTAIVPTSSGPVLSSVSVTPSSATLSPGGAATFTASPTCSGGPCPSGTAYAWTMNRALGTLNSTAGSVVKFTAGSSPGTTYLFVNATLNGVTVQSAAAPITITSGGPPRYGVGFSISPAGCGPVAFNGSAQASGTNVTFLAGSYSATANPCSNFAFQQWNATGGVSPARSSSASTPVTISGNGSLTAWYVWNGGGGITATVSFVVSPAACGPITFGGLNENNGGSGTFATGNYSANAPACASETFSKWGASGSLTLPTLGSNPTTVWVKGGGTLYANYTYDRPAPTYNVGFEVAPATCSPVLFNGTLQANASTASFLAGTYPAHAPACAGYTFGNWEYQPTGGGMHLYTTAWANISIWTNGTVTVFYNPVPPPALTVSLSSNTTTVAVGGSAKLTPTISGGVSPYTCLWSLNGTNTSTNGCGATSITFVHPGTYTYRVWATDVSSSVAGSDAVAITVNALPSPAPPKLVAFANATYVSNGGCGWYQRESFSGSARSGYPGYAWSWSFGDGSYATTENASHTYTSQGPFTAELEVSDTRGEHAFANSSEITMFQGTCVSPGKSIFDPSTVPGLLVDSSIALAALLLAVVAVVLLRRRRRKERPPSDGPVPAGEGALADSNQGVQPMTASPVKEAAPVRNDGSVHTTTLTGAV